MFTKATIKPEFDADDFYWYCTWLLLPAAEKRLYQSATALAKELPVFCKGLEVNPLRQWGIHKRLLVIQGSISPIEWLILADLLVSAGIRTDKILTTEKGYVVYEHGFSEMLIAIAKRIAKLQLTLERNQKANRWFKWLSFSYRQTAIELKSLVLLSSYLNHHLGIFQSLNQPWREPQLNSYRIEFEKNFARRHTLWQKLQSLGYGIISAFKSIQQEQFSALADEYRQKLKTTRLAINLLYQAGSRRPSKRALMNARPALTQANAQSLAQLNYTEPLIAYGSLMASIQETLPNFSRKTSAKNSRQYMDVSERLETLKGIIADQSLRFKSAHKLSYLSTAAPYIQLLARTIQDLTDYLLRALIVDKRVLNFYVAELIGFIDPLHPDLNGTGLAYRLLISSLCLLSLREVVRHATKDELSEQKLGSLLKVMTNQLDAIKLALFIQNRHRS